MVFKDKRVQLMRQREHDMEVRDRQKFPLSGSDPMLTRLSLAFWAVAIPAGIIGDGPVAATLRAGIDVTAKSRCTATHDGAHHFQLLETDSVSMTVKVTVCGNSIPTALPSKNSTLIVKLEIR